MIIMIMRRLHLQAGDLLLDGLVSRGGRRGRGWQEVRRGQAAASSTIMAPTARGQFSQSARGLDGGHLWVDAKRR
eukprot:COSAG01_NODE_7825_length_3040_cov_10.843251_2_plen_75_part_00